LPLSLLALTCREYLNQRGKTAAARRELEDLRTAINHRGKENLHSGIVRVTLPPKSSARTRWLTRDEAARLLRVCWLYRETQTVHHPSYMQEAARAIGYGRGERFVGRAKFSARKIEKCCLIEWSERQDLNLRPPRPERGESTLTH